MTSPKGTKSQGTELYMLSIDATPVLVKIGAFTDWSGLGAAKSQIDATNLDSLAKEYLPGLKDNGAATFNLNLDPTDTGQISVQAVDDADATTTFVLLLSDGTAEPTLTTGVVTPPTTRSSFMFSASVQEFSTSGSADAIVKAQLQLRITGAVTKTWKSA